MLRRQIDAARALRGSQFTFADIQKVLCGPGFGREARQAHWREEGVWRSPASLRLSCTECGLTEPISGLASRLWPKLHGRSVAVLPWVCEPEPDLPSYLAIALGSPLRIKPLRIIRVPAVVGWVTQKRSTKDQRMRIMLSLAVVTGGAFLTIAPAFGHVTLAVKEAPVGADYKAGFRVPHGCNIKGLQRSN